MYKPPFSIGQKALKTLAEIGALQDTATSHNWQIEDVLNAHATIGGEASFRQTPPAPHWIPVLVQGLLQWVNTSCTHPLIRAAVFHYEFVHIRPFEAGNRLVAGRIEKAISRPLIGNLKPELTEEDYKRAMAAADASEYISALLCAILAALRTSAPKEPASVPGRRRVAPQDQILRYLRRHPGSKRQDILAAIPALSARVLDRHLQAMREQQLVEYRGSRKTGAYYPGE